MPVGKMTGLGKTGRCKGCQRAAWKRDAEEESDEDEAQPTNSDTVEEQTWFDRVVDWILDGLMEESEPSANEAPKPPAKQESSGFGWLACNKYTRTIAKSEETIFDVTKAADRA